MASKAFLKKTIDLSMKKPNTYKLVLSSVFFVLFVITALALILSAFQRNFSQLFAIFNEPGHFYAILISIFYICGILMSFGYFIATRRKHSLFIPKLLALAGCVFFCYLFLFNQVKPNNAPPFSFFFSLFFYLAFLGLGLWRFLARWHAPSSAWIKYLIFFAPSMNVCLIILFASSFQPYLLKHHWHAWVDFALFGFNLAFLIAVLAKRKEYFGIYEYANLLVLIAGIVTFMLSAHVIWQVDRYNDARWAFYLLGFLGWYGEWMYLSFKNGAPS
ncbi:hypothetical protein FNE76_02095 [Helicobacter mehlei]|uniref:Uncharacterized protein n=2 Tax=Helicobacter mehlei TaxID=2316080 RepID=A0A553V1K2_9HELI|nr:hypothetical protein [Helicobacter mehlei]TSA86294.1 hypothetical protein FNE76_02095 [Helicobacter mehlei]